MRDRRRCSGPLDGERCGKPATLVCTDASGLQWFACEAHRDDDGGAEGTRGRVVKVEPIEAWLRRGGVGRSEGMTHEAAARRVVADVDEVGPVTPDMLEAIGARSDTREARGLVLNRADYERAARTLLNYYPDTYQHPDLIVALDVAIRACELVAAAMVCWVCGKAPCCGVGPCAPRSSGG